MQRILALFAALAVSVGALAQTAQIPTATSPALDVMRLAPQLVAFAGGDVNFASLVNGLALGQPVTLTTTLSPGVTQVVTFTPAGTMTPLQIAQVLESARQSLITRGIAVPTAQQLGTTLVGGTLATPLGTTPSTTATAVIATTSPLTTNTVTTAGVNATPTTINPAAALQQRNSAAVAGSSAARNTSDSLLPRGISDTPPNLVPGTSTTPATTATSATPTTPATATPVTPAAPALVSPARGSR